MILNCPVLFFLSFFYRVSQNPRAGFFSPFDSKITETIRNEKKDAE